ncbi:M16 family metallopeptidase [Sandaracinus amylolyticus]|uniref:M16 family metallopeptidase n=1 Tax=Sandaracinus amylolyticus TaxID=927083 RepID=UPI001F2CDC19|nr:pitrilysin family protein [Sandaracinus amylolyticus]UJR78854.1 Insulinase family protein [Sandaracinus amylolyticus]
MTRRGGLDVRTRTLTNGLPIVVAPLPHLHTATLMVGVRVGSRHETTANAGISHFLEHMLFRGTAEHPTAHEFNLAVEELGGTLHAATRADFTTYELTVPPEHAIEGLAILAEIFGTPSLRNLELEKRIVREEILEGVDEDGRDVDPDDIAHRAVFGVHPLGAKIAGSETSLSKFGEADLRAWHAKHYVARNAVVVAAGAVDPDEITRTAERCFGILASGERQEPSPFTKPTRGPRFTYVDSTGSQTDVRVSLPSVGEKDPLRYATDLLTRVLDDGMSTRLFRTVVEDTGLAYETFGSFDPYEDTGLVVVGAAIEHNKTASLVTTVLDLLVGLRDRPIEPRELAKAKKRALFDLTAVLDDAEGIAEWLVMDRIFELGESLERIAERIDAVTLDDLAAAAQRTIRPDHLQVVAVGVLPESVERETKRIVQAFR